MSVKKILCNPPAERVAVNGDYELLGMFEGAGEAVYHIEDEKLRDQFVAEVTAIEADYVAARKDLAGTYVERMNSAFHLVLDANETEEIPV